MQPSTGVPVKDTFTMAHRFEERGTSKKKNRQKGRQEAKSVAIKLDQSCML